MDIAKQRLKQIQSFFTNDDQQPQWQQVVVLPDDARVAVATLSNGSTRIIIGERNVLDFHPLALEVALVLSAIGTSYEQNNPTPRYAALELSSPTNDAVSFVDFWGAIYALWTLFHTQEQIPFIFNTNSFPNAVELTEELLLSGLARRALDPNVSELFLLRSTFWQGAGTGPLWNNPRGWLRGTYGARAAAFPSTPTFTRTSTVICAHPLRPPKPRGGEVLYRRFCAGVEKMLSITMFNPTDETHMATFHRWHNDELVNKGWGEAGTMEQHVRYVQNIVKDPHVIPVLLSWDGELMGYCEMMWVKENHAGTYIPDGVWNYDRGVHLLVGEEKFRGGTFTQAWFRSMTHFLFLSDPRTLRYIGEPKRENAAVLKLSLDGRMHIETAFDFPYKRSVITVNHRERIFREDYLR